MERSNHALCQLTASLRGQDEEKLRQVLELLFFAYRDFTGEADAVLADFGFGRAHPVSYTHLTLPTILRV